ncbi:unnamed protein product [Clonostachys rosea]|uniref:Mannan endo-1,6-alpha-mannosidase n=1 Tax=Bionectria ochroleuca TaxID=29856 RepID=A0ABY6U2R0_BIOOC|nr:unnamed protein product [Clonostachys rosea]
MRLTLASVGVAALSLIAPLTHAATADDYVSYTVKGIESMNSAWYDVPTGIWNAAWWNSANTLTTYADFASLRLDEANKLNIGGYMRNTFTNAQKTSVKTSKVYQANGLVKSTDKLGGVAARGFANFLNEFYDDEGWWALALIRTFDVTREQEYLDSAVRIFEDMQTGQGTPCNGGIYWKKDRKYVSAISNELYLSVAASLANRIPSNPQYLEIANNQWNWFKNSGLINKNNLINDGLNDECKNNGQPTWSYNQGVILGGLVELNKATGDAALLDTATNIAKAAIKALSSDKGILVETTGCEKDSALCGIDGKQFKGVFLRNLRYLHQARPNDDFKNFIIRNADSIWGNNRNGDNKFGVAWTGPYTEATGPSQSSALDALVAAVAVA